MRVELIPFENPREGVHFEFHSNARFFHPAVETPPFLGFQHVDALLHGHMRRETSFGVDTEDVEVRLLEPSGEIIPAVLRVNDDSSFFQHGLFSFSALR